MKTLVGALLLLVTVHAHAGAGPAKNIHAPDARHGGDGLEVHERLRLAGPDEQRDVALTLDACGGRFDKHLIELLIIHKVPATLFVTRKWLDANPVGTALLLEHPELFELEDHGAEHVPAIVGAGKRIYGLPGEPDLAHLAAEVTGGATAITRATGQAPSFYRGAAAVYDVSSKQEIGRLGYRIAGFSVNADAGATLTAGAVAQRLRAVQPGDVVIAHMNKPAGQTAEGFARALPELEQRGYRFVKLSERQLVPL